MKYLKAWGIELEGGWDDEPFDADLLREDGSVRVRGDYYSYGEIPSPPFSSWPATVRFVRSNYPDHVGASCGMHVHMSFNNIGCYSCLMDSDGEYQKHLLGAIWAWKEKHRIRSTSFVQRLKGMNQYCADGWEPDGVKGEINTSRYKIINWRAYNRHGTVEVRVLPMFRNAKRALSAIKRVLAATELYLRWNYNPRVDYTLQGGLSAPPIEGRDCLVLAENPRRERDEWAPEASWRKSETLKDRSFLIFGN